MSSEKLKRPPSSKKAVNQPLLVPSFWQLGWMLFMQPSRLRELFVSWGFEGYASLVEGPRMWQMCQQWKRAHVRTLLARLYGGWLLFFTPLITLVLAGVLRISGIQIYWPGVAGVVASGVILGVILGIALGVAVSLVFGVTLGVAGGVFVAVVGHEGVFVFGALVALGMAFGAAGGVALRMTEALTGALAAGVLLGIAGGLGGRSVTVGIVGVVVGGLGVFLPYLRSPLYLLEAISTWLLLKFCHFKLLSLQQVLSLLPFRHHELIWFPLPGLRAFIVALGKTDAAKARNLIVEAAESLGQKRPARHALAELQAWNLERAAQYRSWARAAELDLDFLRQTEVPAPVRVFQNVARDLGVTDRSHSHHHVQEALSNARKHLEGLQNTIAGTRRPSFLDRCLLPVVQAWLEVVAEEEARLAERKRQQPQVPTPFVAGLPLLPKDRHLFKGRRDLVRIIDHDLIGDRRAPLLLLGQRRMGKSSLLNMLSEHLGTGTTVIVLSFQGLSGSQHVAAPHRWIAQKVAEACREAPQPPGGDFWGPTMDWLRSVDEILRDQDRRMLIAIDEVERLQDEIALGRANTDFLDLVRAMGDRLERIRVLLVSAYPFDRLGPHWVDRLISVMQCEIVYLEQDEARDLMRYPIDDFPDIYPVNGVQRITRETRGHPYLVQLICGELCQHLNKHKRLKATDEDIEIAIDASFEKTKLFDQLWEQQTQAERSWLARLADAPIEVERPDRVLRGLIKRGFVERRSGTMHVAVPMFADWIRDQRFDVG